ncbi:MAG: hypothetical protein GX846_05910 [Deltaproteobacteria bacterium]|nr:hypothetical protein [Deltaproteobacteria bacterium]
MPWTKILLSSDDLKSGKVKKLTARFREDFHEAGMPTDMAMFAGQPTATGYFPYYLTPACLRVSANLIKEYAGVNCEKPRKSGFEPTMVIGFSRGWDLLIE